MAVVGTAIDTLIPGHHDPKRHSMAVKLLLCFSLKTNGSKLLSTQKSEGNIDCINGIRFLSMAWVVLGHTFYGSTLVPMENVFKYGDVISAFHHIQNAVIEFFTTQGFRDLEHANGICCHSIRGHLLPFEWISHELLDPERF